MGWLKKAYHQVADDIVGLDPNGGGVYGVARDVLGDTIADDVLGMDPNGGGAIKAYNIAIPLIASYYGGGLLGASEVGAEQAAAQAFAGTDAATAAVTAAQAAPAAYAADLTAAEAFRASEIAAQNASNTFSAPIVPKGVDLVNAGGITQTAGDLGTTGANIMRQGEIADYSSNPVNAGLTAPAVPAGSGLLSPEISQFLTDNPLLMKALVPVLGGLLGGLSTGGGGSSSTTPKVYGAPQAWKSPIQQGIYKPPAIVNPPPLRMGTGQPNTGAWRYTPQGMQQGLIGHMPGPNDGNLLNRG